MKIYLIGYMAAGKSRLGKELSSLTGLGFADLDDLFEEKYRIGIVDFFDKYGEATFRQIEHQLLFDTALLDNVIIATGGGTACSEENMAFIRKNGVSIYIRMETGLLTERLKNIKRARPLLKNVPPDELEQFVRNQVQEREHFYLQADHIFDAPLSDYSTLADLINGLKK